VSTDDNPFAGYAEQYRQEQLPFDELPQQPASPHRRRPRGKGPRVWPPNGITFAAFIDPWWSRINKAEPTASMYRVAIALQREATLKNSMTVQLSNKDIGRGAKYRALRRLEDLGLIRVAVRPGRALFVTLLVPLEEEKEDADELF
jgi:hypothetical protein